VRPAQWVVDMRIWVLVVAWAGMGAGIGAGLCACNFDSSGHYFDDPKLRPADAAGTGAAGGASAMATFDAGPVRGGPPMGGAVASSMDGAVLADSTVPGRDDAGVDGGAFGDNPTPDDPEPPEMTGGLKCADTFCPFAEAPIEPCCTAVGDVEVGAAREVDRCGLSFASLKSDFFATQCWQRDQPGVVDESCPPVQVDLHSEDPGCCTDQGTCGGVDSDHGLGCHEAPGVAAKSCGMIPVDDEDAGTGEQCDLTGRYALEFNVDMVWGGRSGGLWELTDDGRGTLRIMLLLDIEEVDDGTLELRGNAKTCGVELPTFYSSTLCEAYQPIFPTRLWESAKMPSIAIAGHLQCSQPGCIATIDAQTVLLGIELNNPESPWPTADQTDEITCAAGAGAKCFPDHDDDGRAGLTVELAKQGTGTANSSCRNGYEKEGAPLSSSAAAIFDGVRRSDRVLLGVRMKIGGSLTVSDSCMDGGGSAIAQFVNSRAWGCLAQQGTANYPWGRPAGANDPCTATEAAFLDANLPIYKILTVGEKPPTTLELANTAASKGPLIRMVRLSPLTSDVTCADVRNAAFP
jgi:hypothetical protein